MSGSKSASLAGTLLLLVSLIHPFPLRADDLIEKTGVAIGVTAGNMWFVPIKATTVSWGLTAGAISFILSLGNTELTKQIWHDTTQGPYLITPPVARTAIGERPELKEVKGER